MKFSIRLRHLARFAEVAQGVIFVGGNFMSRRDQILPLPVGDRLSGPHGTLLFSADDLRELARETESTPDGLASANEPVLEGVNEGVKGLRFSLRPGRNSIGRSPNNDLVIDDSSVSASHAWIVNDRGRCAITNTLSTNGTFVNDERIDEATLNGNDQIRFGQAEFVFLTCEPGAARRARLRWILAGSLLLVALAALAWWLI